MGKDSELSELVDLLEQMQPEELKIKSKEPEIVNEEKNDKDKWFWIGKDLWGSYVPPETRGIRETIQKEINNMADDLVPESYIDRKISKLVGKKIKVEVMKILKQLAGATNENK